MADQRLPEKIEKFTASPDLEVHVVDPNDPTQHPSGSSFRMKLSNLLNLGTNTLLGLVDVLITTYGGNGGKILRVNLAETGIEAIDNVFLNLTDVTESTYANFDNYVVSVVPGGGLQFTPKTFLSLTDVSAIYLDERNEGSVAMVIKNKITGEYSVNFKPVPTFDDLFGGSAIIRGGLTYRGFGLNYTIWGERYIINGRLIEINVSGEVTNDPGDSEFDRFDVYYIETDNQNPENITVGILKGTPEEDPIIPTLDLSTQVQVSVRLIKKDEATDPNAITNVIYDENELPPLEWSNTLLPSGGDLNYGTDPKVGLVSIYLPQILSNAVLGFQRSTFFTYLSSDFLIFYIKPIGFLAPQADFQFKLINSENGNYWNLLLGREGLRNYGLDINSNDWQLIQIQLSEFASTSRDETLFDTLEISFDGTPELQLDWFVIQSNVPNPVTDVSTLDSVTNKGNRTDNSIYIGQAFSSKSSFDQIQDADDNILVPKSYVVELFETPSGLVLFEIVGDDLYLSIDGEMPSSVKIPTSTVGYRIVDSLQTFDLFISEGTTGNWLIINDFTLDEDKTLPASVSLGFNGGVIDGGGFSITGNNSSINSNVKQVFTTGTVLEGTWTNKETYLEWWGVGMDGLVDASSSIEAASYLGGKLIFPRSVKIDTVVTIDESVWLYGDLNKTLIVTDLFGDIFRSNADRIKVTNFKHVSTTTNNTLLEPLGDCEYVEVSNNYFSPKDDNLSNYLVTLQTQTGGSPAININEIKICNNYVENSKVFYADTITSDNIEFLENIVLNSNQFVFRVNALQVDTSGSEAKKVYARGNVVTDINGAMVSKNLTARMFQIEALYCELYDNTLNGAVSIGDAGSMFESAANFAYIKQGSYKIWDNKIKGVVSEFWQDQIASIIDDKATGSPDDYIMIYDNVFDQSGVTHAETPESCIRINESSNVAIYNNKFFKLKSYATRFYCSVDTGNYPKNLSFTDNKIYEIDFPVPVQVFQNATNVNVSDNTIYKISNKQGFIVNAETGNRIVGVYQSFNNGFNIEDVIISNNNIMDSEGTTFAATLYVNASAVTSKIKYAKIVGNNIFKSSTNTGSLVRFRIPAQMEDVDIANNIGFVGMTIAVGTAPTVNYRTANNLL